MFTTTDLLSADQGSPLHKQNIRYENLVNTLKFTMSVLKKLNLMPETGEPSPFNSLSFHVCDSLYLSCWVTLNVYCVSHLA